MSSHADQTAPESNLQQEKESETRTIDALLLRYLSLLDEYTALRTDLQTRQAGLFQSLARANFAAERGAPRYGPDYFDERMQASRRVRVRRGEAAQTSGVSFAVGVFPPSSSVGADGGGGGGDDGDDTGAGEGGEEGVSSRTPGSGEKEAVAKQAAAPDAAAGGGEEISGPTSGDNSPHRAGEHGTSGVRGKADGETAASLPRGRGRGDAADVDAKAHEAEEESQPTERKKPPRPNDPLRWFGILTPFPLRQAQAQAVEIIEETVPRLATVSAQMAEVELEVRRARKRRAKAERSEEKRLAALEREMGRVDVSA